MCDVTGMGGSSIATAPWTIIVLPMTGYVIDSGWILDSLYIHYRRSNIITKEVITIIIRSNNNNDKNNIITKEAIRSNLITNKFMVDNYLAFD